MELEKRARSDAGVELAKQALRRFDAVPGRSALIGDRAEILDERRAGRFHAFGERRLGAAGARWRRRHAAEAEACLAAGLDVEGGAHARDVLVEALGELVDGEGGTGHELGHADRADE